jgi:hypothetical protein
VRGLRRLAAVALVLTLATACGKYGPPRRVGAPPPPPSSLQTSPIPPQPIGPQGTGILDPDSGSVAPPVAPPEEPEEESSP